MLPKHKSLRHSLAAGALTVCAFAGAASPAQALVDPATVTCESVTAELTTARADAKAAQKAFANYNRAAMRTLVKSIKAIERAEARVADRQADRLTAKANRIAAKAVEVKGPRAKEAREIARAAISAAQESRRAARDEARDAAQLRRAGFAGLKRAVAAERNERRAERRAAHDVLKQVRQIAEDCAQPETEPETEPEQPTS